MSAVLSEEQLDYLRSIDSPTVANAIEIFDIRPRTEGYMTPDIKARFPELGPVVGYAVTAKISAKNRHTPRMPIIPLSLYNMHVSHVSRC